MEGPTAFGHKSSERRLHHSSPLETLVRRTSSRRHATKQREAANQIPTTTPSAISHFPLPRVSSDTASPPRPYVSQSAPDFPLLHSHFRSSAASAMTNGSVLHYYMHQHSKSSLHTDDCEPDDGYYYDENSLVYGEHEQKHTSGRLPLPASHSKETAWVEPATGSTQPFSPGSTGPDNSADGMRPSTSTVPTVVVSSPSDEVDGRPRGPSRQPIVSSNSPRLNFSRPGRPPILSSEEQKRQVLERNSRRPNSPRTQSPVPHAPIVPLTGTYGEQHLVPEQHNPPINEGSSHATGAHSSTIPLSSSNHSASSASLSLLPPALRAGAPPNGSSNSRANPRSDNFGMPSTSRQPNLQPLPNPTTPPLIDTPPTQPQTPLDYLQLGIQYHESNRLKDSAVCFEKSAKEQGGCGVGMLMWGLTLRHGWGCEKNEKSGYKWLAKAAESAVEDLEKARRGNGFDAMAVKEELVIAIYEVGQCFFQGWGVRKDRKMAVSYYRVAANLGDADAQQDLAFCLANGKGCKKDKKEAAKWYRAAVAQGASDVGMAWIYKDKYKG